MKISKLTCVKCQSIMYMCVLNNGKKINLNLYKKYKNPKSNGNFSNGNFTFSFPNGCCYDAKTINN